jgi:Tfp pilus assembly protein FimT
MRKSNPIKTTSQRGFTLIEIVSMFAVIGVIGFSTPKLLEHLHSSQELKAINQFASAVAFANQQAIKLKTVVSLCAANARRNNCSAATSNWSQGYLVKIDNTGEILKALPAMPKNLQLISTEQHAIHFSANGLITSSRRFKICDDDNATIRNLIINSGREVRSANFTFSGNCTS